MVVGALLWTPRTLAAPHGIASSLLLSPTKQRLRSCARSPTRPSETYFARWIRWTVASDAHSRGNREIWPKGSSERRMTVFVYVNTSKQVGDADHIKVFTNVDAAEKWFEENDPEGIAFEYEVLD